MFENAANTEGMLRLNIEVYATGEAPVSIAIRLVHVNQPMKRIVGNQY